MTLEVTFLNKNIVSNQSRFVYFIYLVRDNTRLQPETKQDVKRSVSMECNSEKSVYWYFESNRYHPTSRPIHNSEVLVISSLQNKHDGVYFCFGYSGKKHFLSQTVLLVFGNYYINGIHVHLTKCLQLNCDE